MIRSILLALDDTPGALAARDLAFALARRTGAALTGAIVLDVPHTRGLHEPVPLGAGAFATHRNAKLAEAVEQEAEQVLTAARAAGQDLRFEVVRREEAPEEALLAEAARHDLIVIGRDSTLGREACEDGLSPCIEALIADGVRPLLVVPPGFDPRREGCVLLGHHGSRAAMRTAQLFALLGLGQGEELRLLGFGEGAGQAEGLAGYLAAHGCRVRAATLEGQAHETLLAEARDLPARMLVLGAEEEGRLARLILGSATARLLRAAPCPVFIHG